MALFPALHQSAKQTPRARIGWGRLYQNMCVSVEYRGVGLAALRLPQSAFGADLRTSNRLLFLSGPHRLWYASHGETHDLFDRAVDGIVMRAGGCGRLCAMIGLGAAAAAGGGSERIFAGSPGCFEPVGMRCLECGKEGGEPACCQSEATGALLFRSRRQAGCSGNLSRHNSM